MLLVIYVNGELSGEVLKSEEELVCEVHDVRRLLHSDNKQRFIIDEKIGHKEDLLVSMTLDPRFKLMNFPGCTNEMKEDTENYLRSAYNLDWIPTSLANAKKKQ